MRLWEIVLIFIYSRDSKIVLELVVESTIITQCGTEHFRMNGQFQNCGSHSAWAFHSSALLFNIWILLISAPAPCFPDPLEILFPLSQNHQHHYYSNPCENDDTVWALFHCVPSLLLSHMQDQVLIAASPQGLSLLHAELSLPSHRGQRKLICLLLICKLCPYLKSLFP